MQPRNTPNGRMAYRLALFFLVLTACGAGGPEVLFEDASVSVIRQPLPKDFNPRAMQQYSHGEGETVLNGGAVAIVDFLARTQGQWLQEGAGGVPAQSLVVLLKNNLRPEDPAALTATLAALDVRLVATGDTNHYVFLRGPDLPDDILLSTRRQKTGLTQNAALYQFDTAGVHVMNNTGIPLRMDQDVIDRYLPDIVRQYGEGIDSVDFSLEVLPYPGVRLVSAAAAQ